MLSSIGSWAREWSRANPWTNVYGLARSILALQTLALLLANPTENLFPPAVGTPDPPTCASLAQLSLFCVVPEGALEVARWTAIVILLVVVSGWRPRITGVLHWWVSFSIPTTAVLSSGGDAITSILTFLLIPLTLTDPRRWHWATLEQQWQKVSPYRRFFAWTAALLIRIQMSAIYFHSAVGKVPVEEWANGTAIYYWLTDPWFGMPPWIEPALAPLLTSGVVVTVLSWGTILLEFFLFAGLVMDKRGWPYLLTCGIALHVGIAVLQGLPSFSLAMIGALLLYLRPLNQPFDWIQRVRSTVSGQWERVSLQGTA